MKSLQKLENQFFPVPAYPGLVPDRMCLPGPLTSSCHREKPNKSHIGAPNEKLSNFLNKVLCRDAGLLGIFLKHYNNLCGPGKNFLSGTSPG